MTLLNDREIRRHELFGLALLFAGLLFGAVGAFFRARRLWVPEYPHAMIGLAAVMVFVSLAWRWLAFAQPLWRRPPDAGGMRRMMLYSTAYSLIMVIGGGWLLYEKQRQPDIAWMREHGVSAIVLYTLLAMAAPWALVAAVRILRGLRNRTPI